MAKLKILQCLVCYLPNRMGGIEIYVQALNGKLLARGHEVKILVPEYPGEEKYPPAYEGIPIITYPEAFNVTRAEFGGNTPGQGLAAFSAILKEERPDIVHFHQFTSSNGISIYHVAAAKALGIRIVYTNHLAGLTCQTGELMYRGEEPCDGKMDYTKCARCDLKKHRINESLATLAVKAGQVVQAVYPRLSELDGKVFQLLSYSSVIKRKKEKVALLLQQADRFIVLTDWYYKVLQLNKLPLDKVVVIKQGLPFSPTGIQAKKPGLAGNPIRLVFIGRVYPEKGLHILFNALANIDEAAVSLDIYGRIDDPAYEQKCRQACPGRKNIQWHGLFDNRDLVSMIGGYDLLVLPSMIAEMAPLVIREAFSVGVPVIGTHCGGIAEEIRDGHNGFLFEMGDVKGLEKILNRIIRKPDIIKSLSQNIPAPRSFEQVAQEVEAEYFKLL